jgi:hypothetical protein
MRPGARMGHEVGRMYADTTRAIETVWAWHQTCFPEATRVADARDRGHGSKGRCRPGLLSERLVCWSAPNESIEIQRMTEGQERNA